MISDRPHNLRVVISDRDQTEVCRAQLDQLKHEAAALAQETERLVRVLERAARHA
jgi:hypothetical protein